MSIMKIDLSHTTRNETISVREDEPVYEKLIPARGPARIELSVHRTEDDVIVRGTIQVLLTLECSRCLKQFNHTLKTPFDGAYQIDQFNETQEIDLYDDIRQAVILGLPVKPLCRDTCRGMCGQCGMNLNNERCGCQPVTQDTRMEKLKRFKFK